MLHLHYVKVFFLFGFIFSVFFICLTTILLMVKLVIVFKILFSYFGVILIKQLETTSLYRGVEQLAARRAHNPKVVSSSLTPATKIIIKQSCEAWLFYYYFDYIKVRRELRVR